MTVADKCARTGGLKKGDRVDITIRNAVVFDCERDRLRFRHNGAYQEGGSHLYLGDGDITVERLPDPTPSWATTDGAALRFRGGTVRERINGKWYAPGVSGAQAWGDERYAEAVARGDAIVIHDPSVDAPEGGDDD